MKNNRTDFGDDLGVSQMPKKETIKPPSKKELTDASKQLSKGHSSGGRTMADASVAKRQRRRQGKPKEKVRSRLILELAPEQWRTAVSSYPRRYGCFLYGLHLQ